MSLKYTLIVTGPAYGSQQASSAYLFAEALFKSNHQIMSIFFYQDGVSNANSLTSPASDEYDLVRAWQSLANTYHFPLQVCSAAAFRRGVIANAERNVLKISNLQPGFELSGLASLAEAMLLSDRVIQF